MMDFYEWVKHIYGEDFDLYGLTDAEYYELEDIYNGQFDVEKEFEKEVKINDA